MRFSKVKSRSHHDVRHKRQLMSPRSTNTIHLKFWHPGEDFSSHTPSEHHGWKYTQSVKGWGVEIWGKNWQTSVHQSLDMLNSVPGWFLCMVMVNTLKSTVKLRVSDWGLLSDKDSNIEQGWGRWPRLLGKARILLEYIFYHLLLVHTELEGKYWRKP